MCSRFTKDVTIVSIMSQEQTSKPSHRLINILIGVITISVIALLVYLFIDNFNKTKEISNLQVEKQKLQLDFTDLSNTLIKERSEAESTITNLTEQLLQTEGDLNGVARDLRAERERNMDFEDQISSLTGTVRDLDKLSRTDRELLQKYSRTYFLNENFVPMKLTQIKDKYVMSGKKDQYFHGDALRFLENMLDDAKRAGHDIRVISAYRSFDEQNELKGQFTQVYGSGANTFSADQGYSEHQLGTAVDIADTKTGATSQSFANTDAYKWLLDNAHRYGFILSYPEGNNFYIFEPWHWRFVGVELARDLNRQNAQFYDWDQRRIDEYLIKIFD